MRYTSKLIVLRGNSGSGKSTVARKLREGSKRRISLVEQDYLRRIVLREKESEGSDNLALIRQTVLFCLERGYDVILEGILTEHRYGGLLRELAAACPEHYYYYFDISFEETLRRHATKENAQEFGEKEMRVWYRGKDLLGLENERIIPEASMLGDTVTLIEEQAGL
jgi:predicted kinase